MLVLKCKSVYVYIIINNADQFVQMASISLDISDEDNKLKSNVSMLHNFFTVSIL